MATIRGGNLYQFMFNSTLESAKNKLIVAHQMVFKGENLSVLIAFAWI
jgi:uncharacterized protein (DUF1778 family)